MDAREPRVRRRGFFLHSETNEPDTGEHENPEGVPVRFWSGRPSRSRQVARSSSASGRSQSTARTDAVDGTRPQVRSGSATGSRQRGHLPR
jgi:hypothetical protein